MKDPYGYYNGYNGSALSIAINQKGLDRITLLLNHGATINIMCLKDAIYRDSIDILKLILEKSDKNMIKQSSFKLI